LIFSLHERSKTRQDKFESILEIIESVVSSPFVKAEADSVEYVVLVLKRSTATFFLLHCDEWDRVVALPRHKFVTGATLLQLGVHLSDKRTLLMQMHRPFQTQNTIFYRIRFWLFSVFNISRTSDRSIVKKTMVYLEIAPLSIETY
jgi:hypothetical protein